VNPFTIGVVVFVLTLGAALAGIMLRGVLPDHHLDGESRDTVKLGIGLIATMTALVLGLVTASTKAAFDALDQTVKHTAADILSLDRVLARYGPEAQPIRVAMKQAVGRKIDLIWPPDSSSTVDTEPPDAEGVEALADGIYRLTPQNDDQRMLQSRANALGESLLETRWLVVSSVGTSVPVPFLLVLMFWLALTFASFGLFAPRNATVVAVLFLCALSVAAAVFLILEMDTPFEGMIKVSAEPLRYAYERMNQ
jgi:hypothetical protein